MLKATSTILAIAMSLSLAACSGGDELAEAEAAAALFHQQYAQRDIDGMYASAAPLFREATTPKQFADLMDAIKRKLGKRKSSQRSGWQVNYDTSGNNTVIQYQSVFEGGEAVELFTFDHSDPPKLVGYNIQSTAMMVK